MVKDTLLKCKRRPFATQKMPFYKAFYNLLNINMLQSRQKKDSAAFVSHQQSDFVKVFQTIRSFIPLFLFGYARQAPTWLFVHDIAPVYKSTLCCRS